MYAMTEAYNRIRSLGGKQSQGEAGFFDGGLFDALNLLLDMLKTTCHGIARAMHDERTS